MGSLGLTTASYLRYGFRDFKNNRKADNKMETTITREEIVAKRKETMAQLKAKAEELHGEALAVVLADFGHTPDSQFVRNNPKIIENLEPAIAKVAMEMAKKALGKVKEATPRKSSGKTAWDKMRHNFAYVIGRLMFRKLDRESIIKLFNEALEAPVEYTPPKVKHQQNEAAGK